jgi:RNA polymerase sigma factor FliA
MIQPFAIATSPARCGETVACNPPAPTGRKSGVPVDQLRPGYSELVFQNQRLVRRVAWQVHRRVSGAIDIADLIQVGLVALIEAAQCYEDRGYRFSTYASVRIRGAMIDELRRAATISRAAMARVRDAAATRKAIEALDGRPASDSDIAGAMGISMADYHAIACDAQGGRNESINDLYSDQSHWFADDAMAADEVIDRNRLSNFLADAIGQLPEREARVLHLYFTEERDLAEIGKILDIGAARVCQIKKAAIARLKTRFVDWIGLRACAASRPEPDVRRDARPV